MRIHIHNIKIFWFLPVPICWNFYKQEQAWTARAHPPQQYREGGDPTCETTKHETRQPINCRTIHIHNIINAYFGPPFVVKTPHV